MRRLFKTRLRKVLFLTAMIIAAAVSLYPRRLPTPPDLITQRPGEPAYRWKFMRTAWTFDADKGDGMGMLSDLLDNGKQLLCVNPHEICCLNKADGGIAWRKP